MIENHSLHKPLKIDAQWCQKILKHCKNCKKNDQLGWQVKNRGKGVQNIKIWLARPTLIAVEFVETSLRTSRTQDS